MVAYQRRPEAVGMPVRLAPRPLLLAGRKGLLAELDARLAGGPGPQLVALCGLGGAGKTSVAVEYAHRHLAEVSVCWQFPAEDPEVLEAEFTALAAELGPRDLMDLRDPVATVHGILARAEVGWLVIFDNVTDRPSVERFIPPAGIGQVLVTTQNQHWPHGQALDVPVLDTEAAAGFLVNRTGDADRWAARELAMRLGGLPLALEQAAAYMQATGVTAAGYVPLFRERQADLLARGEVAGHPADVATTLGLALSRLAEHAPAAAGLLQLLSFLAPEPIPLTRLLASQQAAGLLSPEVAATVGSLLGDPVMAGDAVTALRRYSLIAPAGDGLVLVHRLVQAITRAQLTAKAASCWKPAAAALVEAAVPADPQVPAGRPACTVLLPHARAVLSPASDGMRRIARCLRQIDTTVPNTARAWDYLLGGRDNFEADRRAVRQLAAVAPALSAVGRASRAFHRRVVRYLAAEAGVRQFLDIGCGMPTAGNTHEIAQAVNPACKIVYVDNDPVVLSHGRALLTSTPQGVVSYLDADVRDIGAVLDGARQTLDFSQPVAVMLMAVLAFIDGHALARSVVAGIAGAVPSGSYFAIRHAASDLDPALPAAAGLWNATGAQHLTLRGEPEVAGLVEGLDLVDPDLVTITEWRPDPDGMPGYGVDDPDTAVPIYGLVARKL
jgi:hypothetical protein